MVVNLFLNHISSVIFFLSKGHGIIFVTSWGSLTLNLSNPKNDDYHGADSEIKHSPAVLSADGTRGVASMGAMQYRLVLNKGTVCEHVRKWSTHGDHWLNDSGEKACSRNVHETCSEKAWGRCLSGPAEAGLERAQNIEREVFPKPG